MKRILTILAVVALLIGIAGFSQNPANAGPATCAPSANLVVDKLMDEFAPASLAEKPSASPKQSIPGVQEYACNLSCARTCNARYPNCYDRNCRDQRSACVRSCGC